MIMKNTKSQLLVSAEEAVRIAEKACTVNTADFVMGVCRTWWSDPEHYKWCNDPVEQAFMLSSVYMAGKMQGIREERRKKRRNQ